MTTSTAFDFRLATAADIPALITLVTSAYRGDASRAGWTTEADILDGQRVDAAGLQADLERADSIILLATAGDEIHGCCHLASEDGAGYFGMFAVNPQLQGSGLGKLLMARAETFVQQRWGHGQMRMTVIDCRHELIAFYQRRGYVRTGITKPFPYGDARFGLPKRDDLRFEILEKTLEPMA
jgi:GNAT superfamily N-acetyltransferase